MDPVSRCGPLLEIKRIYQVVLRIRGAHRVMHFDQKLVRLGRVDVDRKRVDIDARLKIDQRLTYPRAQALYGFRADGFKKKIAQAGSELRAHHSLAGIGPQDDKNGFADIFFVLRHENAAAGQADGKRPSDSEERALRIDAAHPPISTVGIPITIGAPHPDVSPMRAAGLPPINTVTLPLTIGEGGC